jgi:ankyrin repeat protein
MEKIIRYGTMAQFKDYLIEHPFQLFKKSAGYPPLEIACMYGNVPVVTYILSLDKRLCYHSQPIYLACEYGQVEIFHLLMKHGAPLDADLISPVIRNGHVHMLSALIHYGVNVNNSVHGVTPLAMAVLNNDEQIVRLLIQTPSFTYKHVTNTVWTAITHGYITVASLLLQTGKFDRIKESSILRDTLAYNPPHCYQAMKMLLAFGVNPNFGLNTPLDMACREYSISMVELLIEYGADIHQADKFSTTPIVSSVIRNHVGMVELLLRHGANVNSTNIHNVPVLHLSCIHGHLPMIGLLVSHGATITTTTLIYALRSKDIHTIQYILQQGVNEKEFTDMKGDIWLASCNTPSVMELITPLLHMFPLSTLENALLHVGNGLDLYTWERVLSPSLKIEWPLFIQEATRTSLACYMTVYESPDTMFRFRLGEEVEFSNAPLRCLMRPYGARPIRNRVVRYLIHPHTLRRLF